MGTALKGNSLCSSGILIELLICAGLPGHAPQRGMPGRGRVSTLSSWPQRLLAFSDTLLCVENPVWLIRWRPFLIHQKRRHQLTSPSGDPWWLVGLSSSCWLAKLGFEPFFDDWSISRLCRSVDLRGGARWGLIDSLFCRSASNVAVWSLVVALYAGLLISFFVFSGWSFLYMTSS